MRLAAPSGGNNVNNVNVTDVNAADVNVTDVNVTGVSVTDVYVTDLQNVVRVLESFLGQVSLALDLDVERFWDVRNDEVDQPTHAEDDMLKCWTSGYYSRYKWWVTKLSNSQNVDSDFNRLAWLF